VTTKSRRLAAVRRKAVLCLAALPVPAGTSRVARLSAGCASLALLAACSAGGNRVAMGPSTNYYVAHASHSYQPPGPQGDPWGPYIQAASQRFDVPGNWIRQVMRVESGGNEYTGGQLTVSAAGAMGLMQLEPETYREMAARYGLGSDPFNPYDNIMAGTAYIHEMYSVYGSPGFLAAYNAGPGRLDAYINYHEPLPQETKTYVAMIAPNIQGDYPNGRSEADQLALNTQPQNSDGGILPAGVSPPPPAPAYVAPVATAPTYTAPAYAAPVYTAPSRSEIAQAQLPVPQRQPAPAPVQMAALAPSPPAQSSLYAAAPAYTAHMPAPPPLPPQHHFSIIPAAMADTPPAYQPPSAPSHYEARAPQSGWAIQVGAYDTSANAKAALGIAELSAVQMLVNGRPMVMSVYAGGRTRYRARVTGLAHEAAVNACDRLSSGPTGCMVLSPDAQS
jgi:hypothetical protein